MHNATEIEKRGTPAAVICTRPFAKTGAAMAKRQGFDAYRIVLIDHPIASASPEQVNERARQALPQVLSIVMGRDQL